MGGYYLIIGAIFIISMIVQNRLRSKFAQYSQVGLRNGLSGKEVAEKMLADNGIHDVQVMSVPGKLTDHYNPANKTISQVDVVSVSERVSEDWGLVRGLRRQLEEVFCLVVYGTSITPTIANWLLAYTWLRVPISIQFCRRTVATD